MKRRGRRRGKGAAKNRRRPWGAGSRRTAVRRQPRWRRGGINRREFLAYSAGAGMLLGMSPLLTSCGDDGEKGSSGGGGAPTEERTYLFDLSYMDTSAHDVILVAGRDRLRLERVNDALIADLRTQHPILEMVPREHLTHVITRNWPANDVQLCYLQRIAHSSTDGSWDMSLMFFHLPTSALMNARARGASMAEYRDAVPGKWARYGVTPEIRAQLNDPVGENILKDTCDQATALTVSHPELTSMEPDSAAHIQCNIVGTQPSTDVLAQSLCDQGPATPDGGWATQTALVDPDTGQTYYNSQGQIQYVPVWSDDTAKYTGQTVSPAMTTTKNDTTLGTNVTDVDPGDADEGTNGAVWTLHDGMPSVDQSDVSLLGDSNLFDYQLTEQSTGHGYYAHVTNVDDQRNVTIMIKNWFVRYLGFYVRYLDADDKPIALSEIEDELTGSGDFPLYGVADAIGANGEFDAFVDLLNPEFVLFGMPVGSVKVTRTIPLPEQATAVEILCSGWGTGSNLYPQTIDMGKVTTIVINISLPALFLTLAAAAGFSRFQMQLQITSILIQQLPLLFRLVQGTYLAWEYNSPTALIRAGVTIGTFILTSGATDFVKLIAESIAEGEALEAVLDAVPCLGNALAAIAALSLVSQITQTSVEVALSPRTYATKLTFTHDVEVTIKHDPDDPAGFPATATHYIVTATFDSSTSYMITQDLPGTTVTEPITATFMSVPYGGMVTVNVGFYSDNQWLAGNGSVGPVQNVSSDDGPLSVEITIKENLVPLESDTLYSHKEVIVLDSQGNHQWQAQTKPPTITTVQGACESADGQLCSLTGITVSTINAAVGYAWESYNSLVRNCANSASAGQLHQFANISVTQNPQSAYLFSGCGFSGTARIAYDLLGKKDWNFYLDPSKNLVRQVRLSGSAADFDGPTSNKAWGKFQLASDAMLLHPAGRLISINSSSDKIEVLTLGDGPVADADAPPSQVYSGTGIREGLLKGPTLAALTPDGMILVLETKNNRIQAFDLGANPVPMFMEDAYYVPLVDEPSGYLDLAVEYTGYMYVLSYTGTVGSLVFRLDIYTPEGEFLARTTGFEAGKVAVNYWRDLFALNYQVLKLPNGTLPDRTEPSVSHWIPSTPSAGT